MFSYSHTVILITMLLVNADFISCSTQTDELLKTLVFLANNNNALENLT